VEEAVSPRDHAFERRHAQQARTILRDRRRTDPTNEVRRSLIDACSQVGSPAYVQFIDFIADCGEEVSAVGFVSWLERTNGDLWADSILHARRLDADGHANSYMDPQEGMQ
jgi:hypothetical protein